MAVALGLLGCTVEYDASLDQQVTTTTQEGDQQLAAWENALAAGQAIHYDPGAYSTIQGDLQALATRLSNSPDPETQNLAERRRATAAKRSLVNNEVPQNRFALH